MKSGYIMMQSFLKYAMYICLLLTGFAVMAACSGPVEIGEVPTDAVCSSIINVKCVKCHYKTRICAALGTKSVRSWQRTIEFMMRQGAQLNADEENKVVACLSSLPTGSAVVCE
ncbi:MAG: hypothetical protein ACWGN1_01435 [Desulfobulbales bacterium]